MILAVSSAVAAVSHFQLEQLTLSVHPQITPGNAAKTRIIYGAK